MLAPTDERAVSATRRALPISARGVALATTYEGGDSEFLQKILPWVDCLEVTPDTIAESVVGDSDARTVATRIHPASLAELKAVPPEVRILVHGVGLSIGSHDGYSRQYIQLLDCLLSEIAGTWHSEHLAYTTVDGQSVGTMLALPRTTSVLDMISGRVKKIQDRYSLPFLLENVISLLPPCGGEFADAQFLNRLALNTGCGLLLDIYNLECDAYNHGFDVGGFLDELDLSHVRELHITGGVRHKGFQLDVHSRLTADSTIELAQRVIEMAGGAIEVVTYELLREAVPVLGHDAIVGELKRLATIFRN